MRRRLLAEARKGGEGLFVPKDKRKHGICRAFQRFKCSSFASECEDKVDEKMGDVQAFYRTEPKYIIAVHKSLAEDIERMHHHMSTYMRLLWVEMSQGFTGMHEQMSQITDLHEEMKEQCAAVITKFQPHLSRKVPQLERIYARQFDMLQTHLTAMHVALNKQLEKQTEEMTQLRVDMAKLGHNDAKADVAPSVDMLNQRMDFFHECMVGLCAEMPKMASMVRLQEDMIGLRADMAKLICQEGAEALTQVSRLLQEHCKVLSDAAATTTLVNIKTCHEIDAKAKEEMDLLKKMHAEVGRFYEVVATMKSDAHHNVIAQEEGIMKTQELMHTLLSNVERCAMDQECANVILVKIASVFLTCTIAFYGWIVWSFNSCYAF